MIKILRPDGTSKTLNRADMPLALAQEYTGGWVEMVYPLPGIQMLVNEDGIAKGLPLNHAASVLNNGEQILGTVVVLSGEHLWK